MDAWKELCSSLAAACKDNPDAFECRQPEEFALLIQGKEPPRTLRVAYSPDSRRLRCDDGTSGWQDLGMAIRGENSAAFEAPSHRVYTVQQLCKRILQGSEKPPSRAGDEAQVA